MLDIFYLDNTVKRTSNLSSVGTHKVWIDATNITKAESLLLEKKYKLHHLTSEDLVNHGIRIKVEEFSNYLVGVFYGLRKEKAIELQEMDFILGKGFLISNHHKEIDSFNALKKDLEKVKMLLEKGPEYMLHRLLDGEVDNFFPVLEEIDDQIEKIEEEVTKKADPKLLQKILSLKRKIVHIKKLVLPQREKVGFLAKNEYKFISKSALPYFRDIYDHAIRVADAVDNYREALGGTFDAYMSAMSNNMNEVMKVLSIIATLALPLGVVSGIYGTNFHVLPGQNFAYGFWVMILGMALLISSMIYMFKRRGWF